MGVCSGRRRVRCQHEPMSPAIHFHPCIHAIDVVQPGLAGRSVAAPGVAHSATGGRDSLFSAAHLRGAAHLRNGTRSDIEPGADICGRAARGQAGRQAGRSVLCCALQLRQPAAVFRLGVSALGGWCRVCPASSQGGRAVPRSGMRTTRGIALTSFAYDLGHGRHHH